MQILRRQEAAHRLQITLYSQGFYYREGQNPAEKDNRYMFGPSEKVDARDKAGKDTGFIAVYRARLRLCLL